MLEHVYVCRHGFRSNWVDASIKTGPTGMPRDPPLAAYGLEQASLLADFLSNQDPRPSRVFSSAFYRCIQTSIPTAKALNVGVALEHGVGEWYSTVNPDTGLHPRPSSVSRLTQYFQPGDLDVGYTPTVYPSRRGESLKDLQDRADLFVEAWTGRVEELYPDARAVVIFAHAASVIALGRALTGDKGLNVSAGCASTSLYRRKRRNSDSIPKSKSTPTTESNSALGQESARPSVPAKEQEPGSGVGEWEPIYLGRADYMPNGVERDWSFRDVLLAGGEVIHDDGDHGPHPESDEWPAGLAPDMERYLRRGLPEPNTSVWEVEKGEAIKVKGGNKL